MSMFSYFKTQMKTGVRQAVKNTLSKGIKKITGIQKLEEENNTLFYFLNTFFDVCETPKASGSLRDLQLCDSLLLKIFDFVCGEYKIPYWLDYGTLLGAYRHKGFIPWDDDLDVAMLRCDYERAKPILKDVLEQFGFEAEEKPGAPMVRIGIGYKHLDTGIWLDIFPVDEIDTNKTRDDLYAAICQDMLKYRKYYYKHRNKVSNDRLVKEKTAIISYPSGDKKILYHGPEYIDVSLNVHDGADVFPLRRIEFEGIKLCVPNNCENYLQRIYGNHFMKFPHDGVEHHGSEGNKLAQWAEKSGTDMHDIYSELENIYSQISKQKTADKHLTKLY